MRIVALETEVLVAELGQLADAGIETRPFFHPCHAMPPYRGFARGPLGVAEALGAQGINLPSGVPITRDEVDRVSAKVAEFLR